MYAGKLTERITFQQKQTSRNAMGEELVTWIDVASVWAEAIPLRGNAFFAANQQQHTVDVRFRIRSRTGLSESMRLNWRGEPYDISALIPGTAQHIGTIEIMAINGVRDGR